MARRTLDPLSHKLGQMQRFFNLEVTGTLDPPTLALMKRPRCGVPDGEISSFSVFGNGLQWRKSSLTYRCGGAGVGACPSVDPMKNPLSVSFRIENYSPDMSQAEVEQSIEKALQLWATVTPLTFSRVSSGLADIMVSFGQQCECFSSSLFSLLPP